MAGCFPRGSAEQLAMLDAADALDEALETIRHARDRQLRHIESQTNNDHTLKNREKANLLSWVLQVLGGNAERQKTNPLSTFHQRVKHTVYRHELDKLTHSDAVSEIAEHLDWLEEKEKSDGA